MEAGATSPAAAARHRASACSGRTRPSLSPAASAASSSLPATDGDGTRSRSSAATSVIAGSAPVPRILSSTSPSASSWSRCAGWYPSRRAGRRWDSQRLAGSTAPASCCRANSTSSGEDRGGSVMPCRSSRKRAYPSAGIGSRLARAVARQRLLSRSSTTGSQYSGPVLPSVNWPVIRRSAAASASRM